MIKTKTTKQRLYVIGLLVIGIAWSVALLFAGSYLTMRQLQSDRYLVFDLEEADEDMESYLREFDAW